MGRAGRKFAFSCSAGHDCWRDIARYMPTRSGRRGARKTRLKAAACGRDRASGASPRARCIVPYAGERKKEREKGEAGEKRGKETIPPASNLLFYLVTRLSCMRLDCGFRVVVHREHRPINVIIEPLTLLSHKEIYIFFPYDRLYDISLRYYVDRELR